MTPAANVAALCRDWRATGWPEPPHGRRVTAHRAGRWRGYPAAPLQTSGPGQQAATCNDLSPRRLDHRQPRDPRQGLSAHVHRLGGEPNRVDANHRSRPRRKVAQATAFSLCQFTLTVPCGCWISTQIFDDVACEFDPASGMDNRINAGYSARLSAPAPESICGRGLR